MPKGWRFPEVCDIWMPLQMDEKDHPRGNFFLDCIGKVKKGVSIEQARAELEAITARIAAQHPDTNTGCGVHVTSVPRRDRAQFQNAHPARHGRGAFRASDRLRERRESSAGPRRDPRARKSGFASRSARPGARSCGNFSPKVSSSEWWAARSVCSSPSGAST